MALFHATQALLAQGGAARLARRRTKGFESGDMTRKMAETSRGATVRNVPGTRSEARRSERNVTLDNLGWVQDIRRRLTAFLYALENEQAAKFVMSSSPHPPLGAFQPLSCTA